MGVTEDITVNCRMQWPPGAKARGSGESKHNHLNAGDVLWLFDAIQCLCSNGTSQVRLCSQRAPTRARSRASGRGEPGTARLLRNAVPSDRLINHHSGLNSYNSESCCWSLCPATHRYANRTRACGVGSSLDAYHVVSQPVPKRE